MARRPKIVLTRKFNSYKDKHKDEKFLICGLGPSIKDLDLNNYKDHIKIGVNDIEKYLLPDYIVIVDKLLRFSSERQEYIINGKCNNIFTQLNNFSDPYAVFNNDRLILTDLKNIAIENKLPDNSILFSNNSTFVACDLARFMGANEIKIIGMDFIDHKNLNTKSSLDKIKRDFKTLEKFYKKKNIKISNISHNDIINFAN